MNSKLVVALALIGVSVVSTAVGKVLGKKALLNKMRKDQLDQAYREYLTKYLLIADGMPSESDEYRKALEEIQNWRDAEEKTINDMYDDMLNMTP